jgi:hypothetical protein
MKKNPVMGGKDSKRRPTGHAHTTKAWLGGTKAGSAPLNRDA